MTFREEIAQLYVATFNRAADAEGLDYWENDSGLTLEEIAQSFFDQPETQALYQDPVTGEDTDAATFVSAIYYNLFDRPAEDAGLEYWVDELESGNISRDKMILAVINGAQDTDLSLDATILANKTEVGIAFADAGLNEHFSVSQVDADSSSVEDHLLMIDRIAGAVVVPDNVFTLTKNIDEDGSYIPAVLTTDTNNGGAITSDGDAGYGSTTTTDENDLIVAGQTEFLHGAYIDAGEGYNTLEVDMKGVYAQAQALLNIQEINVQNLPNVYGDYYKPSDFNNDGSSTPDWYDFDALQVVLADAEAAAEAAATALAAASTAEALAQTAFEEISYDLTVAETELLLLTDAFNEAKAVLASATTNEAEAKAAFDAASIILAEAQTTYNTLAIAEATAQAQLSGGTVLDYLALDVTDLDVEVDERVYTGAIADEAAAQDALDAASIALAEAQAALVNAVDAEDPAQAALIAAIEAEAAAQAALDAATVADAAAQTEVASATAAEATAQAALDAAVTAKNTAQAAYDTAYVDLADAQAAVINAIDANDPAQAALAEAIAAEAAAQAALDAATIALATADADLLSAQDAEGVAQAALDAAVTAKNTAQGEYDTAAVALADAQADLTNAAEAEAAGQVALANTTAAEAAAQSALDAAETTEATAQATYDTADANAIAAVDHLAFVLGMKSNAQSDLDTAALNLADAQAAIKNAADADVPAEAALIAAIDAEAAAQAAFDAATIALATAQATYGVAVTTESDASSALGTAITDEATAQGDLDTAAVTLADAQATLTNALNADIPAEAALIDAIAAEAAAQSALDAANIALATITAQEASATAAEAIAQTALNDALAAVAAIDGDLATAVADLANAQADYAVAAAAEATAQAALDNATATAVATQAAEDAADVADATAQAELTAAQGVNIAAGTTLTNAQTAETNAQTAAGTAQTNYDTAALALAQAQADLVNALDADDPAQAALIAAIAAEAAAQTADYDALVADATAQAELTAAQGVNTAAGTALTNAGTALTNANTAETNAQTAAGTAQTNYDTAALALAQAQADLVNALDADDPAQAALIAAIAAEAAAQTADYDALVADATAQAELTAAQGVNTAAGTALTNAGTALTNANTAETNAQTAAGTAQTNYDTAALALAQAQADLVNALDADDPAQAALIAAIAAEAAAQTADYDALVADATAQAELTAAQGVNTAAGTALTNAGTALTNAQTAETNAQTAAGTAQTNYDTAALALAQAQADLVNALDADVPAQAALIAAIAAEAAAQTADYDALVADATAQAELTAATNAQTATGTTLTNAQTAETNAQTAAGTAQTNYDTAALALAQAQADLVNALDADVPAQAALIAAINAEAAAQTADYDALVADATAQAELTAATNAQTATGTTLTNAQTAETNAQTAAGTAQTNYDTAALALAQAQADLVNALDADVPAQAALIAAINAEAAAQTADYAALVADATAQAVLTAATNAQTATGTALTNAIADEGTAQGVYDTAADDLAIAQAELTNALHEHDTAPAIHAVVVDLLARLENDALELQVAYTELGLANGELDAGNYLLSVAVTTVQVDAANAAIAAAMIHVGEAQAAFDAKLAQYINTDAELTTAIADMGTTDARLDAATDAYNPAFAAFTIAGTGLSEAEATLLSAQTADAAAQAALDAATVAAITATQVLANTTAELGDAQTALTAAQGAVAGTSATLDTALYNVATEQADTAAAVAAQLAALAALADAEADLAAAESADAAAQAALDAAQIVADTATQVLANTTAELGDAQTALTAAQGAVAGTSATLDTALYNVATEQADTDAAIAAQLAALAALADAEADLAAAESADAAAQAALDAAQIVADTAAAVLANTTAELGDAQTALTAAQGAVAGTSATLDTALYNVATEQADTDAAIAAQVAALAALAAAEADVAAAEADVAAAQAAADAAQAAEDAAQIVADTAAAVLANTTAELGDAQTALTAAQGAVAGTSATLDTALYNVATEQADTDAAIAAQVAALAALAAAEADVAAAEADVAAAQAAADAAQAAEDAAQIVADTAAAVLANTTAELGDAQTALTAAQGAVAGTSATLDTALYNVATEQADTDAAIAAQVAALAALAAAEADVAAAEADVAAAQAAADAAQAAADAAQIVADTAAAVLANTTAELGDAQTALTAAQGAVAGTSATLDTALYNVATEQADTDAAIAAQLAALAALAAAEADVAAAEAAAEAAQASEDAATIAANTAGAELLNAQDANTLAQGALTAAITAEGTAQTTLDAAQIALADAQAALANADVADEDALAALTAAQAAEAEAQDALDATQATLAAATATQAAASAAEAIAQTALNDASAAVLITNGDLATAIADLANAQASYDNFFAAELTAQMALDAATAAATAATAALNAATIEQDTAQAVFDTTQAAEGTAQTALDDAILAVDGTNTDLADAITLLYPAQAAYDVALEADVEASAALATAVAVHAATQAALTAATIALSTAQAELASAIDAEATAQTALDDAALALPGLVTALENAIAAFAPAQATYDLTSDALAEAEAILAATTAAEAAAQAVLDAAENTAATAQATFDVADAAEAAAEAALTAAIAAVGTTNPALTTAIAELATAQAIFDVNNAALVEAQDTLASTTTAEAEAQNELDTLTTYAATTSATLANATAAEATAQAALDAAIAALPPLTGDLADALDILATAQSEYNVAVSTEAVAQATLDAAIAAEAAAQAALDAMEIELAPLQEIYDIAEADFNAATAALAAAIAAEGNAQDAYETGLFDIIEIQNDYDLAAAAYAEAASALSDASKDHNAAQNALNFAQTALDSAVDNPDSILDISRAVELEKITITEGSGTGTDLGSLTVVGIRNGAELHLEGGFTEDVNVYYGEGLDGDLTVVMNLGDVDEDVNFNLAHNADTLNIVSTGGGNTLHESNLGGEISTLNISGDAFFNMTGNLSDSFHNGSTATIDASENTAGVDVRIDEHGDDIVFIGTNETDHFTAHGSDNGYTGDTDGPVFIQSVTVDAGNGNNEIIANHHDIVTVMSGTGNDEVMANDNEAVYVESQGGNDIVVANDNTLVSIDLKGGNNYVEADDNDETIISLGHGDNRVQADNGDLTTIVLGDGDNRVSADDSGVAMITLGHGNNQVTAQDSDKVVITTARGNSEDGGNGGNGDNMIDVSGTDVSIITTGNGNDTIISMDEAESITIDAGNGDNDIQIDAAVMNVTTGSGNDTITLAHAGDQATIIVNTGGGHNVVNFADSESDTGFNRSLQAEAGSVISANGNGTIDIVVNSDTNLAFATLEDIQNVILSNSNDSAQNDPVELTITAEQFIAIGAENFSVLNAGFGENAVLNIVVTESMNFNELGINANTFDNNNIDLNIQISGLDSGEVVFALTAEQLHKYIAVEGISVDSTNDYDNDQVIVTDAGYYFNPFGQTDDAGNGTGNDIAQGGGTILGTGPDGIGSQDVTVIRTNGGYERPSEDDFSDTIIINSDETSVVAGVASPFAQELDIIGTEDITFTDVIALAPGFTIDFTALDGVANNLTVDNFEYLAQGGAIHGNGNGSEVLIHIAADDQSGSDSDGIGFDDTDNSLVSTGVSTYVVTVIDGPTFEDGSTATINLCDTTVDLEVMALRGNYNDTLVINDAAWGLTFEMQGGGAKKADGPTGTSNVGTLDANYLWAGADAVVNITHSIEIDTRPIHVEGINIDNATSITVNADANTIIESIDGDTVQNLVFASDADITVQGSMDDIDMLASIDASAVAGTFALDLSGDNNLTDVALSDVDSIHLEADATLSLLMAQADVIGAANITGTNNNTLNLYGLNDEEFAKDNYANINALILTIAAIPEVTLHADTDLTDIAALVIPAGTVLNMTAAQYQQLDGNGTITGDGSLHITDMSQADVGEMGADLDMDGVDINGTLTITLAESVDLSEADIYSNYNSDARVDVFNVGNGMTLTLGDIQDADGVDVNGGTDSVLKFTDTDTNPFEDIDASGFNVTQLMFLNTLTLDGNRNIDDIFTGLPEAVEKVIYNGLGWVMENDQVVTVTAGTTVLDSLVFNPVVDNVELDTFTLNLMGGTEIDGHLRLSTDDKEDGNGNELIRTYLKTVTINSDGTEENLLSGNPANIITGDVTPDSFIGGQDNNLLDLTINATQTFIVEGDVVFNSNVGENDGDSISANDITNATAELTVNGTSDVSLGGIDTSDVDVVGLNVVNNGTGTLSISLDAANVDATDTLSFTGSNIDLTITGGDVDLSNDVLTAVTQITIVGNNEVTLTQAQFDALGAANILPDADSGTTGIVNLVEFGSDPFDATTLLDGIEMGNITLAAGVTTLDGDFTGVDSIIVPDGSTVNLTAEQFNQLEGTGTITGTNITVNITDLTQADVDAGFDLTAVDGTITVTLGEPSVDLGTFDEGILVPGSDAIIGDASFILADDQTLGVVNFTQADGLDVDGGANTTIIYKFADLQTAVNLPWTPSVDETNQIDASGYDVTVLKALAASFNSDIFSAPYPDANVEFSIDDLPSSVELRLYADSSDLGYLIATYRVVTIEEGVSTPSDLAFNDWDSGDEVLTLTLNMEGDATLGGDLRIPTRDDKDTNLIQQFFETLTINSKGDAANTIVGDIEAQDFIGSTVQNNLLNVIVDATSALNIGGDIVFSSLNGVTDPTATLTITGDSDVTVQQLDVSDTEVSTLDVNNNGTGTLTITGSSAAIIGPVESVMFTGTGDIVLGTEGEGVSDDTISDIDASGLSGNLTMDVVDDVDDSNFTFTSGTGMTTMTYSEGDAIASYDAVTAPGILLDFTNAGAGSELHLNADINGADATSKFTVLADADTTIYVDASMDLSGFDASLPVGVTIVLADGVALTLTAEQASDLTIVEATVGGGSSLAINNLGDTAVDFSAIAVPTVVTLEDNDVTVHADSDLGGANVSILLTELADTTDSLEGQTIRFNTIAQAERAINVDEITLNNEGSTNVIWLFDTVPAPVDTALYDSELGRLWLPEAMVSGANVEDLYTTLPFSILRVDFGTLTDLEILLNSGSFDRTMEISSFNTVGNMTFEDIGLTPVEHIESLTLKLGGEVEVGNIEIADVIGAPGYDPASVEFTHLTIDSHRSVTTGDLYATEDFMNDNDEFVEAGEHAQPTNMNTVGDLSVGADNGLDLLTVNLNTHGVTVLEDESAGDGAELTVGTITYETDVVGDATLRITGDNDITVAAVNTTDTEIAVLTIDSTGFTADLDPVMNMDNTEELIITNGSVEDESSITLQEVEGDELSLIDASNFGGALNIVLSQMDSNDDAVDQDAFSYIGGTGVNTVSIETVGDSTPTLEALSTWSFTYTDAAAGSTLTLTDTAVLAPDSNLDFTDVPLVIEGDVDLTLVNLTFDGGSIFVPAGNTLHLTVAQLEQLDMVDITGEGTVVVSGDASDITIGAHLMAVNLDLSAVTIDTDADSVCDIDLANAGAVNDAGALTGFNVIGTGADDSINGSQHNDTLTMGAGDDLIDDRSGDNTYNVDADTDTILGLDTGDILVVSDTATAIADLDNLDNFVATAETMNDGTATINGAADDTAEVNVALAGGANGFTLTGGTGNVSGIDTVIGSDQDDHINGGNDEQETGSQDTMTGNGGNDVFEFNINISEAADLSEELIRAGVDQEILNYTGVATGPTRQVLIQYQLNNVTNSVTVELLDTDDDAAFAAKVQAAFSALGGVSAVIDPADVTGSTVIVTGDTVDGTGNAFEIDSHTNLSPMAIAISDDDVSQITQVKVTGDASFGETYNMTVSTNVGIDVEVVGGFTAAGGENAAEIAAQLVTELQNSDGLGLLTINDNFDGTFTIEGADGGDHGGFFITVLSSNGSFTGSGASDFMADVADQLASADVITDFTHGEDKIDLNLADGTSSNYAEGTEVADYAAAHTAATTALDGTVLYYLTSIDGSAAGEDATGLLFFDANGDGAVDGVISLNGVDEDNFAATDIIA